MGAARVAHENEELAAVLELLDSIVVPASEFIGRSLLSKADPDAIEKVKGEVQALIDNANVENAAHAASAAAASDKLDTDSLAYDNALNTQTLLENYNLLLFWLRQTQQLEILHKLQKMPLL